VAIQPEKPGQKPTLYRVMSDSNTILKGKAPAGLDQAEILRMYRTMLLVRTVDERMVTLQRQGRISFYGGATGQEAAVIGSGAALNDTDWVVPALREGGIALLRGFALSDYVNQLFGNDQDIQRGRQMPCHYGHKDVNYVTLSSCIANQLPHAVGIALAARLNGDDVIAAGYMGDGATSEGDFHTSLEFAARLSAPVLFFCQNNQWAISTGFGGQTAAPSIACRAHGYGMDGYRVDGNDALAVYAVTQHAVQQIRETGRPVLIEALTYRIGAHSTSDDPTKYRDESVTDKWRKKDPILRLKRLLIAKGWWSAEEDAALIAETTTNLRAEIMRAEAAPVPAVDSLFEDVFEQVPAHLQEQREELKQWLS
jgi:TPP-dependent pyruvate/acetoin dehydrogenase alpha subunit